MAKIVVFDSGLGSLSVIKAIKEFCKCDIIYFADSENFPYGLKTKSQLRKIISKTIKMLQERFQPDFIIISSNTPTLLLPDIITDNVVGITPPLKDAAKKSKSENIAILATKVAINSKELDRYIDSQKLSSKIHKVDSSKLVGVVESGKFLDDRMYCKKLIKKVLQKSFFDNNIDVATLSSTHLPFLREILEEEFPKVLFLDPAEKIAEKLYKIIPDRSKKRYSLRIFTSGDPRSFQKKLQKVGIKNRVISFP